MASSPDNAITRNALSRLRSDLCGRYRLERLIGIGGMAAVYAGIHRNGHAVAIKILHEAHASDPDIERLFRREAQLANKIGHPGVVPVIDDDVTEDGRIFLVMPLLRGETVRARAERMGGKLPIEQVVVIAAAALDALAAAHAQKIVHRDIKPENLFVTADAEVKVLDFGIGRFFESGNASATRTGRAIGTPAFMAPEQALGRSGEVDGKTDIWALGATMFTLLSGRFVHEASSPTEIAILAATKPAPLLATVTEGIPEPICWVIDKALSFTREGRWPDAGSMARALLEAAERSGLNHGKLERPTEPDVALENDLLSTHVPLPLATHDGATPSGDRTRMAMGHTEVERRGPTRTNVEGHGPRPRRWRVAVGCTLVLVAATVTAIARPHRRVPPSPSVVAPLAVSVAAMDAETLAACAPPARSELGAGLQLWRDASQWEALPRFEAAVAADPGCAAASVYYLMAASHTLPRRREHFRIAREHRSSLPLRLQDLLDALIPTVSDPPDNAESRRLAGELINRAPADPDAQRVYVRSLYDLELVSETASAADAAARSLANPDPWLDFVVAQSYLRAADVDKAMPRFDHCLEISPDSGDCLLQKSIAVACAGRCEEAETSLHHLVSVIPHSARGWSFLGDVLLADTGDARSARSAFEQRWANIEANSSFGGDAPNADVAKHMDEYRMAIFEGDLEGAVRIADQWITSVGPNPGRFRADALIAKADVLRELGHDAQTRAVACDALAESSAWPQEAMLDAPIALARLCYMSHGMDAAAFEAARASWIARRTPNPAQVWLEGFAGLPGFETSTPAPIPTGQLIEHGSFSPIEYYGRAALALLHLGRPQDALLHAREGAQMCVGLRPMSLLRARFALAQAYEANSIPDEACQIYGKLDKTLARSPTSLMHVVTIRHISNLQCSRISSIHLPKQDRHNDEAQSHQ